MRDPGLPPLPMRAAAGLGLPAGAVPRKNTARNSGIGCNDIPIHRGIAYSATTEPTENNLPIHRVSSVTRADSTTYRGIGYGPFHLNFRSLRRPRDHREVAWSARIWLRCQ